MDFNEDNGVTLFEDKLNLHHLKELMSKFADHEPTDEMPDDGTYSPGRIIRREAGNVTLGEFKSMVRSLLKSSDWDAHLEALFAKVDTSADGMVDWNEFVTYMLLHYRENDNMKLRKNVNFCPEPKIRHITQNKQDIVWCTMVLENPCRYITLSKEGTLCIFDESLRLENVIEIREGHEDPRSGSKRRFRTWYSDIVYMGNVNRIAIGSNSRSIRFWDIVNTKTCIEEFNLYALSDIPSCLDYWYDKKNPSGESLLVMGSDKGSINLFYFLKPQEKLFETPFKPEDMVQKIWMHNIQQHHQYVRHVVIPNVHSEYVRKVRYLPDKDFIMSSSGCRKTPLVMMDVQGKRTSYTYKLSKGVECFDYNRNMNVIATGGIDHVVRLWNPYVQDKPVAFLRGHTMAVIGVVINDVFNHVYSFAKDGVVKVWDLNEYSCLQTLSVRFPCLQHARNPEFGSVNVALAQGRHLLTSCADYIGLLSLRRNTALERRTPVTHETQLCSAVYNSFFKQVATAADDSSVSMWDMESGAKSFTIQEAHGNEEITCLAISTTGRRLYTGARNGTIKVWNFQNGHAIHDCESVGDDEITGLISVGKKKGFLSVGWSRKIVTYQDGDCDTNFLKANMNWKGGQVHRDDILAIDYSPPSLLATGCFDGEILIWSLETQKISVRLRRGQPTIITQKLKAILTMLSTLPVLARRRREGQGQDPPSQGDSQGHTPEQSSKVNAKPTSRPNSRHIRSHKHPEGFSQAPVDKLLFLSSRLAGGITESAVLVSSEAGHLHFWSIYGQYRHHRGSFYASDSREEEESVLALATNEDNSLLLSGDTMGFVYVWNIQNHCVYPTNQEDRSRPPLVRSWKAHDSAIVSLAYIRHSCGQFVLTASTDFTARLWTLDGHYVGTFGQRMNWDLRNPDTYQHPKDPWSDIQVPPKKKEVTFEEDVSSEDGDDNVFSNDDKEVRDPPLVLGALSKLLTKENLALLAKNARLESRKSGGSSSGSDGGKPASPSQSDYSRKGENPALDVNSNSALIKTSNIAQTDPVTNSSKASKQVATPDESAAVGSTAALTNNHRSADAHSMPAINVIPNSASPPIRNGGFFPTQTQREISSLSNASRRTRTNSDNSISATPKQPLPHIAKSMGAMPEEVDSNAVDVMKKDSSDNQIRGISMQADDARSGQSGTIDGRSSNVNRLSQDDVTGLGDMGSPRSRRTSSAKTCSGGIQDLRLSTRSNTSLLGRQVDEGLARITSNRSERRQRVGDIDSSRVTRFGKICAPFQALNTQSTKSVEFPATLPMTQRMRQRGVTCTNESDLQNLTFNPLQLDLRSDRSPATINAGETTTSTRRCKQLEPLTTSFTPGTYNQK